MKKLVIFWVAMFIASLSFAQKENCGSFKEGYFKIIDKETGITLYIERTKDTQTETASDGTVMLLKIKWTGNCTYTLELIKFISNPKEMPQPPKDMVLTIKIVNAESDRYSQETTSNMFQQVFKSEVKRIKKSEMP
jgi:hypothetical protein